MKFKTKLQTWRMPLVVVLVIGVAAVAALTFHADARQLPGPESLIQDRPISTLRDLNQAFIDLAAMVKPTVVTVSTEKTINYPSNGYGSPFSQNPLFNFFFGPQGGQQQQQPQLRQYRQRGLGSGVIVSADGYVLTNNHVVDQADTIYVGTYDGKSYDAKVVGVDPKTDIAVLKIKGSDFDYIQIGNSDNLKAGEIVMAIGSPMSPNLAETVTQGIVSATGRSNVGLADYEDFIQTDAAINPGNSGGPLVNLNGELVGLNTAIVSQSGGFQGIGFAVPSNMAVGVMKSLISQGKVVRGWLGVTIQDVNQTMAKAMGLKEPMGALVGDVTPDSPADDAGVKAGDVITAIDGKTVPNTSELRNTVASTPPGTKVQLDVMRDNKEQEITVKLGELPSDTGAIVGSKGVEQELGFSFSTLNSSLAGKYNINSSLSGAVVTSIDQSGIAFDAGLREGDLIQSADRQRVNTADNLRKILSDKKKGDTILLRVVRDGAGFFIAFKM